MLTIFAKKSLSVLYVLVYIACIDIFKTFFNDDKTLLTIPNKKNLWTMSNALQFKHFTKLKSVIFAFFNQQR